MTAVAASTPQAIDPAITWQRTCALLRCLALDTRGVRKPLEQITPRDLLTRPKRWVDGKQIDCEYFLFNLKFNVSERAIGSIPVDDAEALAEFDRVIAAALASESTKAEAEYWVVNEQRCAVERQQGCCDESEALLAKQRAVAARAHVRYNAQRSSLEADGRRVTHEQIITALLVSEGHS